jgi:hypothetical protein
MSCCGKSLFNKTDNGRKIKFTCDASGPSLVVLNGATTVAKISMCDWSKTYGQYNSTQMYLEAGALNRPIEYGNLGYQINFIFIKIQYVPKNPTSSFTAYLSTNEKPYLSYTIYTNPTEVRYIDDIMMLSGDDNHRIPKIYLNNPNQGYDAVVTVLTSTNSITYINPNPIESGDKVITVENLTYNNLTSDCDNFYVSSTTGTVVTMRWQDITFNSTSGDLELNGKIITIYDYIKGTINLSFINEYNAKQAYSLIKWSLCDRCVNFITGNNPTDDTTPNIIYSSEYTTEIVLNNFPPIVASTCGTSGMDLCGKYYMGTNGDGIIYKEDLFLFLVDDVTDNRDCFIDITYNNMMITPINSINSIDSITSLGLYHITIDVSDYAGNLRTDSFILNVKDNSEPELIVNTLGLELINTDFSTSGTSGIPLLSNEYLVIDNNFTNITFKLNSSSGQFAYLVIDNIVIEVGTYTNISNNLVFVFDNQGQGLNGKLIWDTTIDLGVQKIFILNNKIYYITWDGFGSIIFTMINTNTFGTDGSSGIENIIAFGSSGTNSVLTPQVTKIYLEDYVGKKINKQNILDTLLYEIWDDRDGLILRHINNVDVEITRKSDNVLIAEIIDEGFYDIRMNCKDNDNNIGTTFYQNRNISLNTDVITLYVSKNKAPVIFLKHKKVFLLSEYTGSEITRTDLNNELVFKVLDDSDIIIDTDILNIRIFQIGEESSSGTSGSNWFIPTYTDGSSGMGVIFNYITPESELLYINEIGEYKIQVKVQDSFGLITIAEFIIDVFIT